MVSPTSPAPHRASLSGLNSQDSNDSASCPAVCPPEEQSPASDRYAPAPLAFVLFAGIELAFVFGLLVLTKLDPSQVLKIAGETTAISVAGFFGRNAMVVIWRRIR